MKKRVLGLVLGMILVSPLSLGFATQVEASWWKPTTESSLGIYTIYGTVFSDSNKNGVYELQRADAPLSNKKVSLYTSIADAESGTNALATTTSNGVGLYSFSKLKKAQYFVKYDETESEFKASVQTGNPVGSGGNNLLGIVEVNMETGKLVKTVDLATSKSTSIRSHIFDDRNMNGTMDSGEPMLNGKSIMYINLENLAIAIRNGSLSAVDVDALTMQAITGSLDLADSIYIRTTKGGKPAELVNAKPGLYIALRSPVNFTVLDLVQGKANLQAIIDILAKGDISTLINNPNLIRPSDLSTTANLDYLKLVANVIPKATAEVDKLNLDQYINKPTGVSISSVLGQARNVARLIDNIPGMYLLKLDPWGNVYGLSQYKITRTNDYHFGSKKLITLNGAAFTDLNGDGKKQTAEPARPERITVYDEYGTVLAENEILSTNKYGSYTITGLPYDRNLYVTTSSNDRLLNEFKGDVPNFLANKHVVGVYNLVGLEAQTSIKLDLAFLPKN